MSFPYGRVLLSALPALLVACTSGDRAPPPDPAPTPTALQGYEVPPGVVVEVLRVSGGTGPDDTFQVGDTIAVEFSLEKHDGSRWGLGEMTSSSALVSGPTFNYQRVIAERQNVVERTQKTSKGTYRYLFDVDLPATYLPPYNDSPAVGAVDGELTGQPLLFGTYTVGIGLAWSYTLDGVAMVDAGEATFDFLVGGGTTLTPREVVTTENCNACHGELEAHGGLRRDLTMCLLCHTAGAEDPNDPSIAGGTPGVLIDSRVLFHKIHDGRHLPSVVGIGVTNSGKPNYNKPPQPYQVVDGHGNVRDFSDVGFPVFPERAAPMPRDFGYGGLTAARQALEDRVRSGVVSCFVCHGDPGHGGGHTGHAGGTPGGTGPAQGDLIYAQPTRLACGSCHDDWDFDKDYYSNLVSMPPQPNNSECLDCHGGHHGGGPLTTFTAHTHPLLDEAFHPGLNVVIASVAESGAHNGDGTVDVGEAVAVTFDLQDDAGGALTASQVDELRAIVSGPTSNAQVLLDGAIPPGLLSGPPPFVIDLPERVQLEHVGDSTASTGEVLATARFPHLDLPGAETTLFLRSGTAGGSSTLSAAAPAPQNFVDVLDATGFQRDDQVVIDDGAAGAEEYLTIQLVQGNRLWFSSVSTPAYAPGLRADHPLGATVQEVTLDAKTAGVDYMLDASTGAITELVEFGTGVAVVVSYTTPFVLPPTYPAPPNDSPDLGQSSGEWSGLSMVDGTYAVSLVARKALTWVFLTEPTPYEAVSPVAAADFLVGGATVHEPYALIDSGDSCHACHQDVTYHPGGYRGFETCIACHGSAGAEDRPQYVSAGAPATPGRSVSFRELLHGIHMGSRLAQPQAFQVVGEGPGAYPDDYVVRTYEQVLFPVMPRAAASCITCHGEANQAWLDPTDRSHPTEQTVPLATWAGACAICHDDVLAVAHMVANTAPSGAESCVICHGPGESEAVDVVHPQGQGSSHQHP